MGTNTNNLYLSGISSGLVYRVVGSEFNTPYSDLTSKDGRYLFHPGEYVEVELFLSDFKGYRATKQRFSAIPAKKEDGNNIKVTESQFLVITKDEYDNSEWSTWTSDFMLARMKNKYKPPFDVFGDGELIVYDMKYINENELTGTTFPNRVLRQRVDVDYDIFLRFDNYNECLSRFTDILELMKTYFNNSFDDYSYEYDLNIITNEEDAFYRPGTKYTVHNDVVQEYNDNPGIMNFLPAIISYNHYFNLGGLYKETGCHYQVIYTDYEDGFYTGFGYMHTPYSIINLNLWTNIPKLENDYWWAQVQLHELGHCLGLDHSFNNLVGGWIDLFPDLPVDAIDGLTRFLSIANTQPSYNEGQFFIAYSGEAPGYSAIMSYQMDPSPLYNAPFNAPALMDRTNTIYSANTTYRDYPLTTDPIGCQFINRGQTNAEGFSVYTGLNLNLFSYMTNGEFSEGEITGMTLNFTATTGIEKYMMISYWDFYIDPNDVTWTDTMGYVIYARKENDPNPVSSDYEVVYFKTEPESQPENLISGNTTQQSIQLNISNLISKGILDYDNLSNFMIRIYYLPQNVSAFAGNVILEMDDMNLEIRTTGSTYTRKAKEFNSIFEWDGVKKTSHPGVIFPFNDRFTSYEVKGCKPALYSQNHFFGLNESSDNILYIIEIDLEENQTEPPTYINAINLSTFNKTRTLLSETLLGKFSIINVKDFKVDENYFYVLRVANDVVISGETYSTTHLVERYTITNHINFSFVETPDVSTLYTFYNSENYTIMQDIDLADDGDVYLTVGESTTVKVTLETSQETIKKSITLDDDYITGNSYAYDAFGYLDAKSGSTNSTFFISTDASENYYKIGVLNQERDTVVVEFTIPPNQITGGEFSPEFIGKPKTLFFNKNNINYDLSIVLDTGKILNLTGDTSENGKEISPQGLELIYDFYSGSTEPNYTLSAVHKNYKDVEFSFFSSKTLFLSGLGTNFTYFFTSIEPIGINPSIGDKISGLTYNTGFEYDNNTLTNGETFYQVVDFDDWSLGYNLFRSHQIPFIDDNGGLIDYEFDIVDPSDTQPTINFTGTVRIKLFIYLNSFYGDGTGVDSTSINTSIISALNYFSSHIEENAVIGNYGFNFDISWEIFDFDVIPPYDVGNNTSFREYYENILGGSPKNYSGGSPHIIFSICPEISVPGDLDVENTATGQVFEESVYSTMVVSDLTNSGSWDRKLFGHLLGCNLGLKPTTEQGWSSVFNDLLIDGLDTAGGEVYLPPELTSSGDTTGNQIKYMAYYGELSGLDSKKLSIMSKGSFNTIFYDCPPNAQAVLDENLIDSDATFTTLKGQDIPNVGDKINISYIGFLDNVEIGDPQLDYIEIDYKDAWDQTSLFTTIDLINSGNTNTYNILSGATGTTTGYKTITISGDNLFNVFDYNDQYGFGLKISRERILSSGFWVGLTLTRTDIKIKFHLSDGTVLEKLPTDLFNTTSNGEIVQSYATTANRTELYNSYELNIIKRTLNYYLYNYYKD